MVVINLSLYVIVASAISLIDAWLLSLKLGPCHPCLPFYIVASQVADLAPSAHCAMRFLDFWSSDLFPRIEEKYGTLLNQRPARQNEASGVHYGTKLCEII